MARFGQGYETALDRGNISQLSESGDVTPQDVADAMMTKQISKKWEAQSQEKPFEESPQSRPIAEKKEVHAKEIIENVYGGFHSALYNGKLPNKASPTDRFDYLYTVFDKKTSYRSSNSIKSNPVWAHDFNAYGRRFSDANHLYMGDVSNPNEPVAYKMDQSNQILRYKEYNDMYKFLINFSLNKHPYGSRQNQTVQTAGLILNEDAFLLAYANSLIDNSFLKQLLVKIDAQISNFMVNPKRVYYARKAGWDSMIRRPFPVRSRSNVDDRKLGFRTPTPSKRTFDESSPKTLLINDPRDAREFLSAQGIII